MTLLRRPLRAKLTASLLAGLIPAGFATADNCVAAGDAGTPRASTWPVDIITHKEVTPEGDFKPRVGATVHCQLVVDGQTVGDVQKRETDESGIATCEAEQAAGATDAHMRWSVIASGDCENKTGKVDL